MMVMQRVALTCVVVFLTTQRTAWATESRGDLRLAFRKGATSSDSSGTEFADKSSVPKAILPGKPDASDPKDGDGDLFPYVEDHKKGETIDGTLYDTKNDDSSGVTDLLTSVSVSYTHLTLPTTPYV